MISVKNGFEVSGRDLDVISRRLLKDDFLLKLLYYTSSAPWNEPDLSPTQKEEAYESCIRLVPKMVFEEFKRSFVVITFDKFRPSDNIAYRTNHIIVDVICPLEIWRLSDKMLRPYKIMQRIEESLTGTSLNGIGRVEFLGADSVFLGEELAGFTMTFKTVKNV